MSDKLKEYIKSVIKEIMSDEELEEVSATGAVAGYQTPFAFSKKGKGNVDAAKSAGYSLAEKKGEDKKEPVVTKREKEVGKDDVKILAKKKDAAGKQRNTKEVDHLKRIEKVVKKKVGIKEDNQCSCRHVPCICGQNNPVIKEDQSIDLSGQAAQFTQEFGKKEKELINTFTKKLSDLFLNKKVRIQARKNNPKISTPTNYEITVASIKVDQLDMKRMSVVFVDDKGDSYFVVTKSTVVVLNSENPAPTSQPQPEQPAQQTAPQTAAKPEQPESPLDQAIKK